MTISGDRPQKLGEVLGGPPTAARLLKTNTAEADMSSIGSPSRRSAQGRCEMAVSGQRFSIADLLAAIETASDEMEAMNARLSDLEVSTNRLDEENERLSNEIEAQTRNTEAAHLTYRNTARHAELAEASVMSSVDRVEHAQSALSAAYSDLAAVSKAIMDLRAQREEGDFSL